MPDSRLKAYALTAGGTAAFAIAGAASAEIISTDTPFELSLDFSQSGPRYAANHQLFSLAGGISAHVGRSNSLGAGSSGHYKSSTGSATVNFVRVPSGSGTVRFTGANHGDVLSAADFSLAASRWSRQAYSSQGSTTRETGNMPSGDDQLVGFQFTSGGEVRYGWISYDLAAFSFLECYVLNINSWAYNDVAGEGIIAGQNQAAGSSAVPGLGGLAALAIGAAGVRSRRQRTVA